MELILGQYEIKVRFQVDNFFECEIFHHEQNNTGGCKITPVGHCIITDEPGDDTFLSHRSIQLFLREDIRYDVKTGETTVVNNPERQAGSNKLFLNKLIKLIDSNLPFYHPKLPDEVINFFIKNRMCKEPIGMNICHYKYAGFRERGQLWEND